MTAELRATIEALIDEFLAREDPKLEWVKPAVRTHRFLLLYLGWLVAVGLRPDGSFVRWDHEDDPDHVKPLLDAYAQRTALVQGLRKYPALRALLPARPATAETCELCGGTGELPGCASELICECGGIGWRIPGEPRESIPL